MQPPVKTAKQPSDRVKSATAIAQMFGDGQKLTAVAVEFNQDIDNSKLSMSTAAGSRSEERAQAVGNQVQRLMIGESLDAATAGYRVGYDDASQFNREYKRLFDVTPMHDVERLREAVKESASSMRPPQDT